MAATGTSADGQAAASPRLSLRTALSPARRLSVTGNGSVGSPKGSALPSRMQNGARTSSPGIMGGPGVNGNGSSSPGPGSPMMGAGGGGPGSGGGSLSNSGDIPRLPRVSDAGDRMQRNSGTMLRRSSTISTSAMTRDVINSYSPGVVAGAAGGGGGGPPVGAAGKDEGPGGESLAAVRRERNALRQEKAALLQNKRRLEGVISRMLEQQGMQQQSGGAAQQQEGEAGPGGPARPPLTRGTTLRAQLLKALDESTGLEKQLGCGGAGDGPNPADEAEARIRELTAKVAEMQADHDVTVSRLEGELAYRRTQAAASTAHLHKQLGEAEEALGEARRQAAAAETRVKALAQQVTELRGQLATMQGALADKSQQAKELKDMLGMDKATLNTVIEMLKDQLHEANADRQAKAAQISELEYALVHRDALLAEAHERMNAAAAAAAAAAAGASSAAAAMGAAAARGSASGVGSGGVGSGIGGMGGIGGSLESRSAWTVMAKTVSSSRGRAGSNGNIGVVGAGGGAGGGGPAAAYGSVGSGSVKGRTVSGGEALSVQHSYDEDGFEADEGEE